MNQELVNLTVSPDLVRPIVEAKITSAICESLRGSENMIACVVHRVLTHQVSSSGKISNYPSENKYKFIEWLADEAIKDAAKKAILEWVETNKGTIQKALVVEMKKHTSAIAVSLVESFASCAKSPYNIKAEMHFTQDR